jgi:hypothetical protein
VYDLVQPEVGTLLPAALAAHSPNDVVQLSNAAAIAERSARTAPRASRSVLEFARAREARGERLRTHYLGRSGEPAFARGAGIETYAPLIRLALAHGDERTAERFVRALAWRARAYSVRPFQPRAYLTVETLLALQAVERSAR